MVPRETVSANTDGFAAHMVAVVEDIRATGHMSLRAIAAELTVRGVRTRRGGKWSLGNVGRLLTSSFSNADDNS